MRLFILFLTLFAFTTAAHAQEWEGNDERLSRLEDQVNRAPPQAAVMNSGAGVNGAAAAQFDGRISQLEQQVRDLTGQVERAQFQAMQAQNRLDRMSQDLEVRFEEISRTAASPATPPPAATMPANVTPKQEIVPPATLGTGEADNAKPAAQDAKAEQKADDKIAPAQEVYDDGFAKLRQADYAAAEKAFQLFLDHYPNHQLAGNASYWLGETFYVRGQFKEAAVTFADGYQKYKTNSKAADNLLKLAMALGNLGSKNDACLTLEELKSKFPSASATIRSRADQERKKLACK